MFNTALLKTLDEALQAAVDLEAAAHASDEAFEAALTLSEAERCLERALELEGV